MAAEASEPATPHKDFFISYNRADRAWAEWIAWQLEEAKYITVLQAWDFRSGGNFVLDMQRAAAQAERTIAVLSEDFLASAFTQPEWAAAFAQDPTGEKGILVPVRVRACHPRGLLRAITYIDLVDTVNAGGETATRDTLLAGVQRGRRKPTVAPPFPHGIAVPRSVPDRPRFPGALPPIWNVPHLRNPNFTGREDLLAKLRTALTSGQPAALTQALTGLGGVGKTQLATEYAYRHATDYEVVWWVRAEEPTTLAADYALLARELHLPEQDQPDQAVIVAAVRRWLERQQGWLLIFDNAREPVEVRLCLPQGGGSHVLITSRNPVWGRIARPAPVPVLGRDEAVAFLLRRTGQADEPAAHRLAAALGDLPLALEQAGAYMEAKGRSLAEYEQLFRTHQQELLRRGPPSADYPATVATTWELAFQEIADASPAAAALLHLCAFLAPDNIPRDLLSGGAEHLPPPLADTIVDPLAFDDTVETLRHYSLVEASGGVLAVHRLVQAIARDRLSPAAERAWAEAAVRLVEHVFPADGDEVRWWPECARWLPHALLSSGHAERLAVAAEATSELLNKIGLYLTSRAQLPEAKAAFQRTFRIDEALYGPNDPRVVEALNNLVLVLLKLGELPAARAHLERAVRILETAQVANDPTVAALVPTLVNTLGGLWSKLGDLVGARAAYERALQIAEEAFGPRHQRVAIYLDNLGAVLWKLGELPMARAHLERALEIAQSADDPEAAVLPLTHLGWVLRAQGDLATARVHFERAVKRAEAGYGPDHPGVADILSGLGGVLLDQGEVAIARAHLERALKIDEATYGPDHLDVARDAHNLAKALHAHGDLAAARAHLERALQVVEASYGPTHPDVATVVATLGSVLRDLGDPAAARLYYERALAIRERVLGADHPDTLAVRGNLESLGD